MFTTLTVIKRLRKSTREKLHFVKNRRYISEYHEYRNRGFYTSRLLTYAADNQQSIEKFGVNAAMPIITEDSPEVRKFRYLSLSNTIFSTKRVNALGIYDRIGTLDFLPDYVGSYCGCILIFTKNSEAYASKCDEIYREYGTPIILSGRISILEKSDILFAAETLPITLPRHVYGEGGIMPISLRKNSFLKNEIPPYCDPFLVAAGLYFYEGFKEFGKLKCNIKQPARIK